MGRIGRGLMVKITDSEEARAYFETISPQARCTLAIRAALRVVANVSQNHTGEFEGLALMCLRSLLNASISSLRVPESAVEEFYDTHGDNVLPLFAYSISPTGSAAAHAENAALSAPFAALSASTASHSVGAAARSAALFKSPPFADAESAVYSAISADAALGERWIGFIEKPVWPNMEGVEHLEAVHKDFLDRMSVEPHLSWWREWYLAMWSGTFTDWHFAMDVAHIDWDALEGDSVWHKGTAAVAERIEQLQIERARREAVLHEEIIWDAENAAFRLEQHQVSKSELVFRVVSRAEDAFNDALKLDRGNTLTEQ